MRFTDIDINFDLRYESHQNCPKILSMNISRVFSDHHMWRQNWRQYLWTSLCQFIFLWTSSIVQVFDFLTFDIFFTTWHLLTFWYITWTISAHHWLGVKQYMWPHMAHTPVPYCPCAPVGNLTHCPCGPYPCTPYPLPMSPIPLYPIPIP